MGRLCPKNQPRHIGLSCRIAYVPKRRSFGPVAATGLGGTVALQPNGAGACLWGVGGFPTVSFRSGNAI